ncbi:phage holin family protein [Mobilicoccus caccae]|uniref:Phage holin family protein n=1 Tax=Mobilicoccus caccae TaxID=1859295 RepID=A0ABQ6IUU0_9MICO|nr:phage holin family protein [Mobilicoccus caccae]GMA41196.1 hypothetical protein GCM10025883_32410 [Mobilicoccus caccae]
MGLLLRIVVNAVALWVASLIVPGIRMAEQGTSGTIVTALVVAVVFGLLNALVKPLLVVLGLPLIAVTLGLFLLVINAAMLMLTSWVAGLVGMPFSVDGFVPALLGSLVVTVIAWASSAITSDRR